VQNPCYSLAGAVLRARCVYNLPVFPEKTHPEFIGIASGSVCQFIHEALHGEGRVNRSARFEALLLQFPPSPPQHAPREQKYGIASCFTDSPEQRSKTRCR
jgi:hypothetical protein